MPRVDIGRYHWYDGGGGDGNDNANRGASKVNATWINYVDAVDETSMYALVADSGETLVETLECPTARQRADADDAWGVVSRDGVVVKTVSMGE